MFEGINELHLEETLLTWDEVCYLEPLDGAWPLLTSWYRLPP